MNKRVRAPEFEKQLGGYQNKDGLVRPLRVCGGAGGGMCMCGSTHTYVIHSVTGEPQSSAQVTRPDHCK